MQIYANKRAAILKFETWNTADRKLAILGRTPARRAETSSFKIWILLLVIKGVQLKGYVYSPLSSVICHRYNVCER